MECGKFEFWFPPSLISFFYWNSVYEEELADSHRMDSFYVQTNFWLWASITKKKKKRDFSGVFSLYLGQFLQPSRCRAAEVGPAAPLPPLCCSPPHSALRPPRLPESTTPRLGPCPVSKYTTHTHAGEPMCMQEEKRARRLELIAKRPEVSSMCMRASCWGGRGCLNINIKNIFIT